MKIIIKKFYGKYSKSHLYTYYIPTRNYYGSSHDKVNRIEFLITRYHNI